jgi:WD40 repeat protein
MPHQDWQHLSRINHHPRDDRIYFIESTHTYYVDGDSTGYISVTKLLHAFFPHFDPVAIIKKMRNGKNWAKSKYFGRTDKEIMDEWNENGRIASEAGTAMHLAIEQFLHGSAELIPPATLETIEWKYFQQFWNDFGHDLEPYRMEWEVFAGPEHKLSGSIDAVFRRKSDGKFLIYDWKRSKEIKSDNPFGTGFPPVDHLPDTNYWHYTLQLNVYKWILETYYGLEVADMYLIIIHPDNKSYKRMKLNHLDEEVADMIEARMRAVAGGCRQHVILPLPADEEESESDREDTSAGCMIRLS